MNILFYILLICVIIFIIVFIIIIILNKRFWYKYNKLSIEERHNFTKWPWHEKLRKSFMI